MSSSRFTSFREFYPYYLQEHSNRTCRRLHFVGTTLVISIVVTAVTTGQYAWLWAIPVAGYGFAWLGHYGFEKNRPATFKHPFYSLLGDFAMYRDICLGRISF
ncbi:DUF962 domain-containing protein [Perlucidibaca aquatica]|jgi:hypothetical protein|uniref:DUF962 domain-containing protein n=1 Tax=Perlucidibaca aquatica TaxID=1852776 RepID=UPI00083AAC2D|nr:DUF962 domain-containing protein [Perlucidibaca aquatica]